MGTFKEIIRTEEFAPEMNAIEQYFQQECPQLTELLKRLLRRVNPVSVEEIKTVIENIISGEQSVGGKDGGGDTDFLLNSAFVTTARRVNLETQSPSSLRLSPGPLGGNLMDYFFRLELGGGIPITPLFEWDRVTTVGAGAPFEIFHDPAPPAGSGFVANLVSDEPPSTAKWVSPYIRFENDNFGGDWDGAGWLVTKTAYRVAAKPNEDLWIVADVNGLAAGGSGNPLSQLGLIIAKDGSPTADYYMVGYSQTNMRLLKYIASVASTQAGDPPFALPAGPGQQAARLVVVIPAGRDSSPVKAHGKMQVSVAGGQSGFLSKVFDHKMTVTNTTIIKAQDAVRLGFRINRALGGGGSVVGFSRLMAFSAPSTAELFRP